MASVIGAWRNAEGRALARRFRLRFLLQEFDLREPDFVIGRSTGCHLTIEDPLISRRHLRIEVGQEHATLWDLGSRNGVRVNAAEVRESVILKDGDRISVGAQELMFSIVDGAGRQTRPTGHLRICQACATPYPAGCTHCPHCGAETGDDQAETMPTPDDATARQEWTLGLLAEVISRAVARDNDGDVERLLSRAEMLLNRDARELDGVSDVHVQALGTLALEWAVKSRNAQWLTWAITMHRRRKCMFSEAQIELMEGMNLFDQETSKALQGYVSWLQMSPPTELVSRQLPRLMRLASVTR